MGIRIRRAAVAAALACAVVTSGPASAGSIVRPGFELPAQGTVKIAVFRPDVKVGSLKVGGLDEPNADWTAAARSNIQAAMDAEAQAMNSSLVMVDDFEGESAELLTQYRGLFETVAGTMMTHVTLGDKLPTKMIQEPRAGRAPRNVMSLDWTLGEGARQLKDVTGADYAMFVFTHDSYGDTGRKVAQVLAAGLLGVAIPAGIHIGYAGLVDLETGNIVWFNTDLAMGGDPREVDGAAKRVGQLLAGFPGRSDPAVIVE